VPQEEPPEDNPPSGTTTLYRAVGPEELNDVFRLGDYNISLHGGGKYFALTEEGAYNFADASFNEGMNMTVTSIDVPSWILNDGYQFFDPGGGLESIHFDDDALAKLYEFASLPQILSASWISLFNG
jgi:hypothetical protein